MSVEMDIDLTNIREHFDTVLNRAFLDGDQPITMVDPEHCLQQLHKDWLPGLRGRYKRKGREAVDYYIYLVGSDSSSLETNTDRIGVPL